MNEPACEALPPADKATRQLLTAPPIRGVPLIAGTDWRTRLPHPAAVLVGLGAGWEWSGLRTLVSADLDPSPTTVTMLAAVALIAAAVGPRIPARFVVSLARLIRGRGANGDTGGGTDEGGSIWLLRAVRDRDEALLWLSLAVLSSLAGLIGVVTLPLVSLFGNVHRHLLADFFWTRLTLSAFEWTALAVLTGGMWLMNGLLVAALSPVIGARTHSRREQPGIAGGVLLGIGAALYLHHTLADRGLSASQELLFGALPMFALSVVAVVLSHRAESRPPLSPPTETSAPELTGRAEGWIWISLAAWASGAALSASGWLECESVPALHLSATGFGLSAYLLTMGLGVAFASLSAARESRWTSDCGTVLWAAGVAAGAGAAAAAFLPYGRVFSFLQLVGIALPLGYALHYVERAWLARAGSETLGFAQMTTALLAGAAIGLILNRWWIAPALGPLGTLTTGGLVLMAFGGLSQIHEEESAPLVQRRRLGLVFASLAAAIVLFPTSTERWTRWSQSLAKTDLPRVTAFLDEGGAAHLRRICVIGLSPWSTVPELDRFTGRIDWILPEGEWAGRAVEAPRSTQLQSTHDFRMLQLERVRYDLIYQNGKSVSADSRFAEYSAEWLTTLAACTVRGGRIIVDVPLAGQTTASIRIIATTLAHAAHANPLWRVIDPTGDPALRLLVTPDLPVSPSTLKPDLWHVFECLIDPASPPVPRHLLRRDRLTAAVRGASDDPGAVLAWLEGLPKACAE